MVAIAFYSITGQTERFIKKTQLSAHQIDDANKRNVLLRKLNFRPIKSTMPTLSMIWENLIS